jgi:hypothetical protein
MEIGKNLNDVVKAVGEAFGAQGLAALAGCLCSAFGG